jgi:Mg2+-importing ATPase
LNAKDSDFQTGWFIESILTELFILFIIRTHKNFFQSKPGKYLFILSGIGLVITLFIPYSPFANEIGLKPLPLINILAMFGIVLVYIITADYLKIWFLKKFQNP